LRSDHAQDAASIPIQPEDAFLLVMQLRDLAPHELWLDGQLTQVGELPAGAMFILDLRKKPSAWLRAPFDSLIFYMPRTAFNEITEERGTRRIVSLDCEPALAVRDPIVGQLGVSLLPTLDHPDSANKLFVEYVMLAVHAHVAQTYGGMTATARMVRGGLARWQERRAKELMEAKLGQSISMSQMAQECGLSAAHFARAFRRTTGQAPHRWLLQQRLDRAKQLLLSSALPLAQIALTCGFAEQSHFTRTFTRNVGISPGAWRRQHG
jgi:AraC-like DNA-binding protein